MKTYLISIAAGFICAAVFYWFGLIPYLVVLGVLSFALFVFGSFIV